MNTKKHKEPKEKKNRKEHKKQETAVYVKISNQTSKLFPHSFEVRQGIF